MTVKALQIWAISVLFISCQNNGNGVIDQNEIGVTGQTKNP